MIDNSSKLFLFHLWTTRPGVSNLFHTAGQLAFMMPSEGLAVTLFSSSWPEISTFFSQLQMTRENTQILTIFSKYGTLPLTLGLVLGEPDSWTKSFCRLYPAWCRSYVWCPLPRQLATSKGFLMLFAFRMQCWEWKSIYREEVAGKHLQRYLNPHVDWHKSLALTCGCRKSAVMHFCVTSGVGG